LRGSHVRVEGSIRNTLIRLRACSVAARSSVEYFFDIMVNGNIVLTAHARNEYVQKRQRCVECDCDQIVEVFLSETVIPLQCRMLEQGVGRDLEDGSPVIARQQDIQIGLAKIKREVKTDKSGIDRQRVGQSVTLLLNVRFIPLPHQPLRLHIALSSLPGARHTC